MTTEFDMVKPARPLASPRRYDLDWLRTAVVLMLIPYHTSRLFDIWESFYVKNEDTSAALTVLRAVVDPWGMSLLFVIAGSAAFLALQRRTGVQYMRERILRLIVPLLFGLIVIVPPQAYFAWLDQGNQASYAAFLGRYWAFRTGELMGWNGGFTFGHLWFIVYLFVISLVTFPLFLLLKRGPGMRPVKWLATITESPGAILGVVIPFWVTDLLPGPLVGNLNPFSYIFLFVAGFLLATDDRFQTALDRSWRWALGLGSLTLAAWAIIQFCAIELPESSWQSTVRDFLFYFTTWSWVVGLLGFGHLYLDRPSQALSYLAAASYPYYVIHQTAIVVIGFYVLRLDAGILPKYIFIVIATGALTLGLYELARRWSVTRALLGIRPPRLS